MSTLTGILLDVPDFTESRIRDAANEKTVRLGSSILSQIDFFIKPNVSRTNAVFCTGVGATKREKGASDTIGIMKHFQSEGNTIRSPATDETIENIFKELERKGSRKIREWAPSRTIGEAVSENEARLLCGSLQSDLRLSKRVVKCLPERYQDSSRSSPVECFPFKGTEREELSAKSFVHHATATIGEVATVVKKSMESVADSLLQDVNEHIIYDVKNATKIIDGCFNIRELTTDKARELIGVLDPFIHGGMPLYNALQQTSDLFLRNIDVYNSRVLFVFHMENARSVNIVDINKIQKELKDGNVSVATCYISESSSIEPKKLHSVSEQSWDDEAKKLFDVSSKLQTDAVTRAFLYTNGWKLGKNKGDTRLFLEVNKESGIENFQSLAKLALYTRDSLFNLILSVSLNIYINQINKDFRPRLQDGGTCYANASAVGLHLSMHRILGREGGYPEFEELREKIIAEHGKDGANTFNVLKRICPHHRLHCQQVDTTGALKALDAHRPVIATFRLTDNEWDMFSQFYQQNPSGILNKENLHNRKHVEERKGHAVVLTGYDEKCLRLMNSWGEDWANSGFFYVKDADVLDLNFIDIYWRVDDLTAKENQCYAKEKQKVDDKLTKYVTKMQEAKYKCSKCSKTSELKEFKGTVSLAVCPQCTERFEIKGKGAKVLALHMYLSTLK